MTSHAPLSSLAVFFIHSVTYFNLNTCISTFPTPIPLLNRNFSTPSFRPGILFDGGDAVLKSSGLSAEERRGAPEASSNRELSMSFMDFKPISIAGAPFYCFDRLRDFISGTEAFESTFNILRTKAQDETVPQAKRRWVTQSLSQVGHRNTSIFFGRGVLKIDDVWDQSCAPFRASLMLLLFSACFLCGTWNEYTPTRLF